MAISIDIPEVIKGNGSKLVRLEWPLDVSPPGSQLGNEPLDETFIPINLPEARFEQARAIAIRMCHTWESFLLAEKDESVEDLGEFDWSPGRDPDESKFMELTRQWQYDTAVSSSITEMAMHPAYQQIIGMGKNALPFIFGELEKAPHHWFWALKAITGEDPISPEHRGDLAAMTKDWLEWAEE